MTADPLNNPSHIFRRLRLVFPKRFVETIISTLPSATALHDLLRKNNEGALKELSKLATSGINRKAERAIIDLDLGISIFRLQESTRKLEALRAKHPDPKPEISTVRMPPCHEAHLNNQVEITVAVKETDFPALQANVLRIAAEHHTKIECAHYAYYISNVDDDSCWAKITIQSRNLTVLITLINAVQNLLTE